MHSNSWRGMEYQFSATKGSNFLSFAYETNHSLRTSVSCQFPSIFKKTIWCKYILVPKANLFQFRFCKYCVNDILLANLEISNPISGKRCTRALEIFPS